MSIKTTFIFPVLILAGGLVAALAIVRAKPEAQRQVAEAPDPVVRVVHPDLCQGVDRVGGCAATDLPIIGSEPLLVGTGQTQHLPALPDRRTGVGFVRRSCGQDQADLLEPQRIAYRARGVQMADMNRVESPAKQTNQRCRISPLPKTTYFCEVSPSSPTGPRA